jgi:hypothetical protein
VIQYKHEDAVMVWPAGDYPACLVACVEKQSKAGNDMYELVFSVYNGESERRIVDFIVFPTFTWKLKRLAQALGHLDRFEADNFDPRSFLDENLTVELDIRKQEGFDDKNTVKMYKPSNGSAPPKVSSDDEDGGPLPF